jgi:arylsulfatase A-like enzyme
VTRRELLHRSALAAFGAAAPRRLAAAPEKLNFVFFLIDDLGWSDLACYGNRYHETPNLDRLAAQGMRFTDAYASCPVCSPTRASILTGKYPARLGITYVLQHPRFRDRKLLAPELPPALPLSEVTIPEALKTAGYVSACIGKWHLGDKHFYPENQGFDVNIGGSHIGMLNSFFYPAWSRQTGEPNAVRAALPLEARPGDYMTGLLTRKAEEFLEGNRNRPFFLYLSHYAVHTPIEGTEKLVAKYQAKGAPPGHNPIYAAMVESVDESVGRVLRKLGSWGLRTGPWSSSPPTTAVSPAEKDPTRRPPPTRRCETGRSTCGKAASGRR